MKKQGSLKNSATVLFFVNALTSLVIDDALSPTPFEGKSVENTYKVSLIVP
jgi:hypothetical protein